ncbi:MAG TPA: hypothetical protein VF116_01715 [Ktedonobacterales bacterium]
MASIADTIQRDIINAFEQERINWQTATFDPPAVVRGALAGWAGMTTEMMLYRRLGVTQMSIARIEGTFFAPPGTTQAEVIGNAIHLMMSTAIGFAYAAGYRLTGLRPNWKTGLLGGVIHWSIAAPVVLLWSKVHPRRPFGPRMPGFGGFALGAASGLAFLAAHLTYGTIFGWQYGAVKRGAGQ